MKFLARRTLGGLEPVHDEDRRKLAKIPLGYEMKVIATRPRNLRHHRLYWSLVHKVFENQERYESTDDLHDAIKCSLGYCRVIETPTGVITKPGSIAFDKMDQTAFNDFFDSVVRLVVTHILPVAPEELKREILEMVGS